MIEENVVSAANTTNRTSTAEMERLIRDAGFTPARRKQDYSLIDPASAPAPGQAVHADAA
jgi:cyclic dehypoxanthinyl futalosine synthase